MCVRVWQHVIDCGCCRCDVELNVIPRRPGHDDDDDAGDESGDAADDCHGGSCGHFADVVFPLVLAVGFVSTLNSLIPRPLNPNLKP